jgi:hypothetical protein
MRRITVILIASVFLAGCTSSKITFKPADSSLSQFDYYVAKDECAKDSQGRGFADCMKSKGWICTSNCPASFSETVVMEKPQKRVAPQVLAKSAETIKAEKEKIWVLYAKSQDGLLFYYNPASLAVVDQKYLHFRDQVKYPAGGTKDLSYVWRSVQVNCTDKKFKLSDFVALDKAGKTTDPKVSETAWASLTEESPIGTFAFKTCQEKITPRAEGKGQGAPSSTGNK